MCSFCLFIISKCSGILLFLMYLFSVIVPLCLVFIVCLLVLCFLAACLNADPLLYLRRKNKTNKKKTKNKHILLFSSIYQSSEPHLWLCLSVLFLAPFPADPYAVNMIMWMWRANGNEASFKNSHVKHVKCSCPRVKTLNVPYLF